MGRVFEHKCACLTLKNLTSCRVVRGKKTMISLSSFFTKHRVLHPKSLAIHPIEPRFYSLLDDFCNIEKKIGKKLNKHRNFEVFHVFVLKA